MILYILSKQLASVCFPALHLFYRSGAPIYEIPLLNYAAERILEILLSPTDDSRICHDRPMGITTSATFVVDIDSLKHPDDKER